MALRTFGGEPPNIQQNAPRILAMKQVPVCLKELVIQGCNDTRSRGSRGTGVRRSCGRNKGLHVLLATVIHKDIR